MKWHVIEGEAGCRYARVHGCVAVVVDALRASATAAMLLDVGAIEIHCVREVSEALAAKHSMPDALLFGERGGLPPEGFDFGNSPREVSAAAGRRVIFTTTTGSTRLIECVGANAVYMGCPVNAMGAVLAAGSHGRDVVVIPAGLAGNPEFDAQEDWAGAVYLAMQAGAEIGEGALLYRQWRHRIELDGLASLFQKAPHAEQLQKVGLEADIEYCARVNLTVAVPMVVEKCEGGVIVRKA